MAVFLGLMVALCFGFGDFCGGFTARKMQGTQVLTRSQPIALALGLVAAIIIGGHPTAGDIYRSLVIGLLSIIGLGLLYRGLAIGPIAVVAPITAVGSALIPVFWGVSFGERLNTQTAAGIAVVIVAVVMLSRSKPDHIEHHIQMSGVALALTAGVAFGFAVILLSNTSANGGVWPAVMERVTMVGGALAFNRIRRYEKVVLVRRDWLIILGNALGDTSATILLITATRKGLLAVVAPLQSLYTAVTVVLAWLILKERMSAGQTAGLACAVGGIMLLATG